ncbi:MAG: DUF2982 domain-containing protein [Alteromonadaceae bacterium]|nr:DUF2982 domain-containing protein [Alteromonadaceae bacterium]
MSSSNDNILIKSTAKRNGLTTLLIGVVVLFLASIALAIAPKWLFLPVIFAISGAIVTMLVGWFKIREPEHSLLISRDTVSYQHRCGQWRLSWDDIQRIDCPRVSRGLEMNTLELVGFKLKRYDEFLLTISPRLASHIIMEQRPLLIHSQNKDCSSGGCYSSSLFEDKPFKLENGQMLTGIKAILANRMTAVRDALGYDVFIAASELDREPQAFVGLLRDCQIARLREPV